MSHVKVCGSGVSHCTVCQHKPYITKRVTLETRSGHASSLKLEVNQIFFSFFGGVVMIIENALSSLA